MCMRPVSIHVLYGRAVAAIRAAEHGAPSDLVPYHLTADSLRAAKYGARPDPEAVGAHCAGHYFKPRSCQAAPRARFATRAGGIQIYGSAEECSCD